MEIQKYFPMRNQMEQTTQSLGHAVGTGGRAFLYASAKKNSADLGMKTMQAESSFNKL